jgi:hypothetical protein
MIEKYDEKIKWYHLFVGQEFNEEIMLKYKHKEKTWFWEAISLNSSITDEFIEKNRYQVCWFHISRYRNLSEEFIERNADRVVWYKISRFQKLSEEFIIKHQDNIKWNGVFQNKSLAKDFYERNKDKIKKMRSADLATMLRYQDVSQETIEQLKKGKMVWDSLSLYSDMTREMVIENYDKINKSYVRWNRNINQEVRQEVIMIEKLSN